MKITSAHLFEDVTYNADGPNIIVHKISLAIDCSSSDEAFALLMSLKAKLSDPVESVKVPAARAAKAPEPEPEVAEEKPARRAKAEPEPEPEEKPKKGKKAPEPEPEEDEDSDEEESTPEVLAKPTVKITKELKNAGKLRDVLRILIDAGVTSKKALVRECKALQPHVPVLERIEDIEGRVPKAAEIVDPDIGD
jgi:hypothetical protein